MQQKINTQFCGSRCQNVLRKALPKRVFSCRVFSYYPSFRPKAPVISTEHPFPPVISTEQQRAEKSQGRIPTHIISTKHPFPPVISTERQRAEKSQGRNPLISFNRVPLSPVISTEHPFPPVISTERQRAEKSQKPLCGEILHGGLWPHPVKPTYW